MDRIFRRSALYREEKWGTRGDYSTSTIQKAIAACVEVYNPIKARGIWDQLDLRPMQTGNWTLDSSGISQYVPGKKRDDEPTLENVSCTPMFPVAFYENTSEGVHKVRISFIKNGRQRTVLCDRETIASKPKIVSLANYGISVNSNNASKVVQYFADMEALNGNVIPHYQSVSHVGWVGDNFLPYSDKIKFDGTEDNKALYAAISQAGDYDAWVSFTHDLRKNIYLRLMMAASFASPLIERCNVLPFVFHLWGGTGKGKTVALMVAMSIWGDPNTGALTRTMNMTNAAMMSTVAFLRNLPFGGDELQTIKNNDMNYDQLIMQITEGIERGRMHYSKNLPTRSWKCAFLFTGEERCTSDYSGGGARNRVIEVEPEGDVVVHGNKTVNFITKNYGFAGKRFVEYISDKKLSDDYSELLARVLNECETTPKQAMAATMILLADKLACECIYTDETPLAPADIAPFLQGNADIDVSQRAQEYIVNWAAINKERINGTAFGARWGIMEGNHAFIIVSVLKDALAEKGFSFDAVKKGWAERGFLVKYQNAFTKRKAIDGQAPYCVEIVLPSAVEAK
jgi:hypothetical protein